MLSRKIDEERMCQLFQLGIPVTLEEILSCTSQNSCRILIWNDHTFNLSNDLMRFYSPCTHIQKRPADPESVCLSLRQCREEGYLVSTWQVNSKGKCIRLQASESLTYC